MLSLFYIYYIFYIFSFFILFTVFIFLMIVGEGRPPTSYTVGDGAGEKWWRTNIRYFRSFYFELLSNLIFYVFSCQCSYFIYPILSLLRSYISILPSYLHITSMSFILLYSAQHYSIQYSTHFTSIFKSHSIVFPSLYFLHTLSHLRLVHSWSPTQKKASFVCRRVYE